MLNIEDLKQEMANHVGQLNQLNQRVNEVVGAIKAIQGMIARAEHALANPPSPVEQQEPVNPEPEQEDVLQ